MSWLMYATRSTSRTILPSSVAGSRSPGVREDPVADLERQIERVGDAMRLLVVPEPSAEPLVQRLVERVLTRVPERRVARVMAETDRLGQILVQTQRPRDDAGDRGRLERVRHARPEVVAGRIDEDLGLPLQPAERLGVDDPIAVALERRPDVRLGLGNRPPARLERPHRERRQALLERAHPRLERHPLAVGDPHGVRVERGSGFRTAAGASAAPPPRRRERQTRARALCSRRPRGRGHRRPRRRSTRTEGPPYGRP